MKKLFLILFLGLGLTAFANNGNNGVTTTPNPSENTTTATNTSKENKTSRLAKATIKTEDTTVTKPASKKTSSRMCNTSAPETPGYGIGSFFVELVHNNNIKLVRMFLDE